MQNKTNLFLRLRSRIRLTAIVSLLSFNFLMIAAAWTGLAAIWNLTHIVGLIAIVCSLICHVTKDMTASITRTTAK